MRYRFGSSNRRVRRLAVASALLAAVAATGAAVAAGGGSGSFGTEQAGQDDGTGLLLPTQQKITPVGQRFLVDDGRLLSSTISPDGTKLAALTHIEASMVTIMDLTTGHVLQQVGLGQGDNSVAADGPLYSADGKTLWVPQTADILRFTVLADGLVNPNPTVISLPSTKASSALPSGMALSPDGSRLYVAFNGLNTLGVLDTSSNTVLNQIPVGNAPRQVVLIGTHAYVSNEGGRPVIKGDVTNLTDNTPVVADPSTGAANTGTVSVVDVKAGRTLSSIPVGLQPTAEYLGPDRTTLFVANSNDDSISLIDTTADRVVQTVNVNPLPGSAVGSYPTGITMSDPSTVLVSIGRDNAVAEYHYSGPQSPLQYTGLIPTDWYPTAVQYDKTLGKVVVTNDKGIGTRAPYAAAGNGTTTNDATAHQTYLDTGTVTVFSPRTADQLKADTHQVFVDNTWDQLLARSQPSADNGSAGTVPVPTRPGQQSPIKHVFLIVKENRTYDQVLGDLSKGNGDPALTEFGQNVTPNQHALVNAFGIFDNFYDEGTLSADGHNWLVQADANDYIEKEFGAFYRSYPAQGGDALAYQRNGFLWNAAARAGVSSRSYGEYNNFICFPDGRTNCPANGNVPTWSQWYHDSQVMEGKATGPLEVPHGSYTYADIGSLNAIDQHAYPMFDLDIPDQYRVDIWNRDFQRDVQDNSLANLTLIWLPDDHTSTTPEDPSPPAEVADNDQALGRIVDTISHSSVWPQSAIFVAEDDSQAGVDHVDGHRAPFLLISPYAARGVVNSTYYTQLNVVRTIEAILGMAPMNQEDRAAVPMTDAFTDQPDLTPYTALPSEIPLNLGVDPTQAGFSPTASSASALALVPASERSAAEAWFAWGAQQHFGGTTPREDFAHPEQLNRFDWYAATGWTRPYPGDSRILTPDEVPGTTLPSDYLGDG